MTAKDASLGLSVSREDLEGITSGLRYFRIVVLREGAQFTFDLRVADISHDGEEHWQILPPPNRVL
jgi:hypothetical protein